MPEGDPREVHSPPRAHGSASFARLLYVVRPQWHLLGLGVLGCTLSGAVMPMMAVALSNAINDFYKEVCFWNVQQLPKRSRYWEVWCGRRFIFLTQNSAFSGWICEATVRRLTPVLFVILCNADTLLQVWTVYRC